MVPEQTPAPTPETGFFNPNFVPLSANADSEMWRSTTSIYSGIRYHKVAMCIYVLALCHIITSTNEDVLANVFPNNCGVPSFVDGTLERIKL